MTLAQKFSSAMNEIDDEFIEEALTYERSKKRKTSRVLRMVLAAALISVLLFTSALAFSPSFRENMLNVLVEIFSDHVTFSVEGEEPAGSFVAGKIDYSALEETYRLDPGGCYRVDFASGATFFGNNGEIISITVVAITDGLVGGFEIADDAEAKPITLYGKDATLYWGEDQECAGEIGTEAYIFQIDEENGWLINFRSFKLSPDELVSVAEQVKIS